VSGAPVKQVPSVPRLWRIDFAEMAVRNEWPTVHLPAALRGVSFGLHKREHASLVGGLIQVEFFELAVFGLDIPHRAGDRAHHHGLGLDDILSELNT
jgi:hypothetical protein